MLYVSDDWLRIFEADEEDRGGHAIFVDKAPSGGRVHGSPYRVGWWFWWWPLNVSLSAFPRGTLCRAF
jgi:hypothetical protein